MPPKPKRTKTEVVNAAMNIIRKEGLEALTAKKLGDALSIAPSSVFTHFDSMNDVVDATLIAIRKKYDRFVIKGLSLNPPFKGYAMAVAKFAQAEPKLFITLFVNGGYGDKIENFLHKAGHEEKILDIISNTFDLNLDKSRLLYRNLSLYICGIATLTATGVCKFSDEELSSLLGNACRGFIISMNEK